MSLHGVIVFKLAEKESLNLTSVYIKQKNGLFYLLAAVRLSKLPKYKYLLNLKTFLLLDSIEN